MRNGIEHRIGQPLCGRTYQNDGNSQVLALVPDSAKVVLDVGCGAGDNAKQLHTRGIAVDGITLSENESAIAGQFCRDVYVHDLENGLPPLRNTDYDCVLCSHVLEHICFPQKLLHDISCVLSDSGRLVVALPNLLFIKNRFELLQGHFDYQNGGLMDDTHFRWYTFTSAQALLERHGFTQELAFADGYVPVGSALRRLIPGMVMTAMDRLAIRYFPGLFGYQMLFVYRKKI